MFEQNCENTAAKKPETRTEVDFLFERALGKSQHFVKKPARKIGSKIKKMPTF